MPQVIPYLVYYAAQYIGMEVGAFILATIASYAVSSYSAQEQRKKATRAFNASLTDRGVMIRSGVAPRQMVVGRAKVSGPVIYAKATGSKSEYLHLVVCLAAHEIDAVEKIYFNDVELPALDGSGFVTSGQFAKTAVTSNAVYNVTDGDGVFNLPDTPSAIQSIVYDDGIGVQDQGITLDPSSYSFSGVTVTITSPPAGSHRYTVNYTKSSSTNLVRIKIHRGQSGQTADSDLVSESGGEWTSSHRGDGIAYLYVRLQYDQDVFGSVGVPNISAVCRGAKCRDPRTGTTVWTQNSALIAAWWLRQQEIGLKQPAGAIVDAELSAAANICDENVVLNVGGTTQDRYTTNGTLLADASLRSNLESLVVPMAGSATYVQGRWNIRAGAHEAPDLFLDESDFAPGPINVLPFAPRRDLFNAVTGTYIDAASGYIERQYPLVENATYQGWDGGEQITRNVTMPMIDEALRAQRMAKIMIERARQAETLQATFKARAYNCKPNDIVALTDSTLGWSNKLFVVLERKYKRNEADRIELTLRATAAAVWDWNYGEATTVDLAPNTNLPAPGVPPAALTGVSAETGPDHVIKLPDGSEIVRAFVEWTASPNVWVQQGGRIEIEHKRDDATVWIRNPSVLGALASGYASPIDRNRATLIRVRAVNVLGLAGAWTTVVLDPTTGDTAAPENVSGLVGTVSGADVAFSWNTCTNGDYLATELHRGSWASPTETLRIAGNAKSWKAPAAGSYTWYARHQDRSGNWSTSSASVTVVTTTGSDAPVGNISRVAAGITFDPTDCWAGVRFNNDGTMDKRSGSGGWVAAGNWFYPTTASIGDHYQLFVSKSSGDNLTSGTVNSWQAITSTRTFYYLVTASSGVLEGKFDAQIAPATDDDDIQSSGVLTLIAQVEP